RARLGPDHDAQPVAEHARSVVTFPERGGGVDLAVVIDAIREIGRPPDDAHDGYRHGIPVRGATALAGAVGLGRSIRRDGQSIADSKSGAFRNTLTDDDLVVARLVERAS